MKRWLRDTLILVGFVTAFAVLIVLLTQTFPGDDLKNPRSRSTKDSSTTSTTVGITTTAATNAPVNTPGTGGSPSDTGSADQTPVSPSPPPAPTQDLGGGESTTRSSGETSEDAPPSTQPPLIEINPPIVTVPRVLG